MSTRKESIIHIKDEKLQDGVDSDEHADSFQTFSKDYGSFNVRLKAVQEQYFNNPDHLIDYTLDKKCDEVLHFLGQVYSKQESLDVLGQMGQGNFGLVEKVKDSITDSILVRKKVPKESFSWSELEVLIHLDSSDSIIKLFGFYYDGLDTFSIVLEDAGESLSQLVAKLAGNKYGGVLDNLPSIVKSILQALAYMNNKGYVHCDLKPDNICMKEWVIKLIDFGSCKRFDDTENAECTLEYMPPELLLCRKESHKDHSAGPPTGTYKPDHKTDMWAAFMVFLFLVKRTVPADLFRKETRKEIEDLTDPIDSFFIDGPIWLKDLLYAGLKVNIDKRYTAQQCLASMSHEGVLSYIQAGKKSKSVTGNEPNAMQKRKAITYSQQETAPVNQTNRTRFTIVTLKPPQPNITLEDQRGDSTSQGLDSLANDFRLSDQLNCARMIHTSESSASIDDEDIGNS